MEIRPTSSADGPAFLELLLANREFLRPFEPSRPDWFFTLAGIRSELERADAERRGDAMYAFGIWEQDTGALVGRIALSNIVRGAWQNATLGYFVGEAWGGRGYATEAVRQTVGYGFDTVGLHRIQAAVMPRNVRSIRVVEKNGFRLEGLAHRYLQIDGAWEDHLIYSLTSDERPETS